MQDANEREGTTANLATRKATKFKVKLKLSSFRILYLQIMSIDSDCWF